MRGSFPLTRTFDHTNRQEQLPAIPAIVVPSGNCNLDPGQRRVFVAIDLPESRECGRQAWRGNLGRPLTRTVHTKDGTTYQGDWLVLAAGAQVNFFGTPGADRHAYPLYSLRDAELLRSRVLTLLESVDREPSLVAEGALNFVVVGAGATGTETAGALGDMTQRRNPSFERRQHPASDEVIQMTGRLELPPDFLGPAW